MEAPIDGLLSVQEPIKDHGLLSVVIRNGKNTEITGQLNTEIIDQHIIKDVSFHDLSL